MTTSFTRTIGAAGAVLIAWVAPALASDMTPPSEGRTLEWSATGTFATDYIFRGQSLSAEDPVFQGDIGATYGIVYGGIWGTSLGPEGAVELDFYGGIKPVLGPVTFDFGVVYYTYFWDDPDASNYVEFKVGAEFSPIANLTLTPVFWWVPDQKNSDAVYTVEGTAAYELPAIRGWTPTVSALVGYTDADSDGFFFGPSDDYTYWNAGIAFAYDKYTVDFRYWDTDLTDADAFDSGERFVFTASATF
ncbi:MAG: hypothetical protein J0H65_08670 [Rhizobiales bacterium]|nr:hypothetical protein [Hyphomicrobiales bacterium]